MRAGASDAVKPPPIDLNYVSTRLTEEPVDRETSPRSSSPATTKSIDDEEYYRSCVEEETRSYNELINNGGRPSHPISLGYDVAKNLAGYREVLSFWQTYTDPRRAWIVFSRQLERWKQFRAHQRYVRKEGRFPAYYQRLQDRLKRHEFAQSFQLDENLDRQDKLATWIEFLSYEYRNYDIYGDTIKRLQQQHDKAWKKLVGSKVLRPMETEKSLWEFGIGLQLKNEEAEAERAVEFAKSTVTSAENAFLKSQSAGLSGRSFSQIEQTLSAATTKQAAALKTLEQISKRRNSVIDFHNQTKQYVVAKDNASDQDILLRWILQQVPLISIELKPTKLANASTGGDSRQQRRSKRNHTDDHTGEPVSKRQRNESESHVLSESKAYALETSSTRTTQMHGSHTKSSIQPSKSHSQRALCASRPPRARSHSARSSVVLDGTTHASKRRRRGGKSGLSRTPDSRLLRRSCRRRRPPERFQ